MMKCSHFLEVQSLFLSFFFGNLKFEVTAKRVKIQNDANRHTTISKPQEVKLKTQAYRVTEKKKHR